ncbi:hypothetical protein EG345_05745 [Chryseobacterium carnipullorum]|nr:hypothetical protein EG345_05745 [Chryseobacterium carnipullorum]
MQKTNEIKNFKSSSKYCIRPIVTLFCTIVILPLYLKFFDKIKDFFSEYKLGPYGDLIATLIIFILLSGTALYEIIGRTYFTDKEKVKNGLYWIFSKRKN